MPAANEIRLDDGFSTIITFTNIPTIKLYEKEITPPGYSAGGATETTTMRNTTYRTASPKKLKTLKAMSVTVAYATDALIPILGQVGVNQLITVTFPDGSTFAFYGWVDEFTPNALTEGAQPTAVLAVVCGNLNSSGVETAPVYTAPESSS
jgi:hypothetical protein